MRILKYIFLLILLAFIGVAVFVSTQKSEYDIVTTRVIKSPRAIVFGYVNDFRNWENFNALTKEDASAKFVYPAVTVGKGGSASWTSSDGKGKITTLFAKDNDSLSQKMVFNDTESQISWKFEDEGKATKVTWRRKGKVGFWYKVQSVANGGLDRLLRAISEQSLADLDKTLVFEMTTYSITENGIVYKSGTKFLKQTILSTIDNAPKNRRIMLSKMQHFFRKNKLSATGKPFVLFHSYDVSKKLTRFSVCIPIKDEVRTTPESDISFGEFRTMRSVKITLNGDYSHLPEAWGRADGYLNTAKLERDPEIRAIEVLTKNIEDVKSPSKWVTHLYFPLRSAAAPAPKTIVPRAIAPKPKPVQNDLDEFSIQ
ncbi:SRPBCC family protein [Flavobacterium selenitireducens]|uniref:SRPBCC family protein n=1 Tax=Flavobacterium selenitireducens TaxID=2722704 RepID=UPI00168B6BB7|nr:GyrI-like domain-containing protein [Flavobacterium selenitireducens]MBD3581423.1 transcriptional regulator [Flavobacterium selenitireducens]